MAGATTIRPQSSARRTALRALLWVEFLLLFVGLPLFMATLASPRWAFPILGVMTLIGLLLLALTPGFRWRSLLPTRWGEHWAATLVFTAGAAMLLYVVALQYSPWRLFSLPVDRTQLWLMIMALYPILSVAPQELLYRSLYFERYGALVGRGPFAVALNGGLFGLGHLFYGNPIAVSLSTVGGLAFAYAYVRWNSFPLAWLWHTLAGQLVFTIGLGFFFYHGAIPAR